MWAQHRHPTRDHHHHHPQRRSPVSGTLEEYLGVSKEQLTEALPRLEEALRKEAEEYPALAQTSGEMLAAARQGGLKSLSFDDQMYLLDYYYSPPPLRKFADSD